MTYKVVLSQDIWPLADDKFVITNKAKCKKGYENVVYMEYKKKLMKIAKCS